MKQFAVFIDRDGVINYDPGYFHKIEQLQILPRVAQAISLLNKHDIPAFVITNQSVVARGLLTERGVHQIHRRISAIIKSDNAVISKFYYCPHHPDANISKYKKVCNCRKPATGLFEKAALENSIDITKSFIVGDSFREIEAARKLGCTSIAVRCGSSDFRNYKADHEVDDLYEAVRLILSIQSS